MYWDGGTVESSVNTLIFEGVFERSLPVILAVLWFEGSCFIFVLRTMVECLCVKVGGDMLASQNQP